MSPRPLERIARDVVAQCREMKVDVEKASREAYTGGHVLDLVRLHPLVRASKGRAKDIDVSRATLHLRPLDDGWVSLHLDADCRIFTFHRLALTAPPHQGRGAETLQVGAPLIDDRWHAVGTAFASQFLTGLAKNLRPLSTKHTQLTIEDDRLSIKTRTNSAYRTIVASMIAVWQRARPVKATGADRTISGSSPKKPRRPPPAERAAERLRDWVSAATTTYAGQVERVRDTIEARVQLDDIGPEPLRGQLVFGFSTVRTRIHEIGLRAILGTPPLDINFHLSPQRGLSGFLTGLSDDKVGDKDLDRAFVMQLGKADPRWVRALRGPLLACVPSRPTLHATRGRLIVNFETLRPDHAGITEDVRAALALWHAAARHAIGDEVGA